MAASQTWSVRSGADIGRAVADVRATRGLTQLSLAQQSGISRGYLAQIESGKTVSLLEHELRILRRLGAAVTITIERDDGGA